MPLCFMHGVHFGFYSFYFHPLAKETITLSSKGNESAHSRHILWEQIGVKLIIISERYYYLKYPPPNNGVNKLKV